MTEQEAIQIAQNTFHSQDLFIMLSVKQANMMVGSSVPYVGSLSNGEHCLFVFTSYEKAKAYIDKNGYEVLDGIYPIAKIEQEDQYRNFFQICNIAVHMGIQKLNIDLDAESAFGCSIMWILQVNQKEPEQVSILLSKEEAERIMEENEGQVPLRMNPMPILDFENPFAITEERSQELFQHVFDGGETAGDYMKQFRTQETLVENCFLCDQLNTSFIPMASEQQKEADVRYFIQVSKMLETVIWERVFEHKLYTIQNEETGKPVIRNQSMYLIYTDRFKYTGNYTYMEINSKEEILEFIKENELQRILVTDGPHFMAVVWADTITQ